MSRIESRYTRTTENGLELRQKNYVINGVIQIIVLGEIERVKIVDIMEMADAQPTAPMVLAGRPLESFHGFQQLLIYHFHCITTTGIRHGAAHNVAAHVRNLYLMHF